MKTLPIIVFTSVKSKIRILGFDRVIRLSGWISFFKNQNEVVLIKKKKQKSTGCNRVFDRVLLGQPDQPVTPGFSFPYFFFNSALFQLRINPPSRTKFQNYTPNNL